MNAPKIHDFVSTVIIARHGKAVAAEGRSDAERELNELGIKQAKALGSIIVKLGVNTALSSPLKRAMGTMRIATKESSVFKTRSVAELTCSDDQTDPIQIMWEKFGNAPISKYFAKDTGEYLKIWCRTALNAVIRELKDKESNQKVLIIGHAVLQNALLWAIAEQLENSIGSEWKPLYEMAETPLNEGEAFAFEFVGERVRMPRHLRPMTD